MTPEEKQPENGTEITGTQARQGTTLHRVRYVLAGTLALSVLALIVAFFAG